jgi:isopenicillin N synthase-like dioxygenase
MEWTMEVSSSRRLDVCEIPVIDIGPLVKGEHARAGSTIDALARACRDVGFLQVTNHGVSNDALAGVVAEAARFFALSIDEKMKVAIEDSPIFRGYLPLKCKGEVGSGDNLHEAFIIFHERRAAGYCPMHGPNQWPVGMPGFKEALLSYFAAVEKLAHAILPGFALAIGLKCDVFDPMFDDPMMMLKLNYYPAQAAPTSDNEIGIVAHCDSGAFTILWQDDVGGLEVLNSGEWVVVPPIPGAFVINIGNLMQTWTNGRFQSTSHRVVNRYGKDRYSIAFFANPNYATVIRPLLGDPSPDFEPFVSGQYQKGVYRRIYPQRPNGRSRPQAEHVD